MDPTGKNFRRIRSAIRVARQLIEKKKSVNFKTGKCRILSIYQDFKGCGVNPETGNDILSKNFRKMLRDYQAYRPNYKIVDDKVEGGDFEEEDEKEEEEEVPRTQKKVKSKSAPRVACVLPPAPVTAQEVSHKGLADGHVRHLNAKLDHLVELTVSLSSALNEARQEISSIGSALSSKGHDERPRTDHSLQTNAGTNNVGKSVSAFLFKFDGQMDGLQIKFDAQKEPARVDDANLVNHDFLSGGGGDRGSVHQSNHN